jgi:hypothetical protein
VVDDTEGIQTVYLTLELEQPWTSEDLDALASCLPGEPCVQDPTNGGGRVAIVSVELTEADEEVAARASVAAVRRVLTPRGRCGKVTEAVVYTEGASWAVDAETLSDWNGE